jgi:hypothetical protein
MYISLTCSIEFVLACVQLKTEKIGFIKKQSPQTMEERKAQEPDKHNSCSSKSLFTQSEIVLDALKARILELEQIRDNILYELEKLKNMSE